MHFLLVLIIKEFFHKNEQSLQKMYTKKTQEHFKKCNVVALFFTTYTSIALRTKQAFEFVVDLYYEISVLDSSVIISFFSLVLFPLTCNCEFHVSHFMRCTLLFMIQKWILYTSEN